MKRPPPNPPYIPIYKGPAPLSVSLSNGIYGSSAWEAGAQPPKEGTPAGEAGARPRSRQMIAKIGGRGGTRTLGPQFLKEREENTKRLVWWAVAGNRQKSWCVQCRRVVPHTPPR